MAQNIYDGATIQNICFGSVARDRGDILYADLVDRDGQLLISATMDYIVDALKERLKPSLWPPDGTAYVNFTDEELARLDLVEAFLSRKPGGRDS